MPLSRAASHGWHGVLLSEGVAVSDRALWLDEWCPTCRAGRLRDAGFRAAVERPPSRPHSTSRARVASATVSEMRGGPGRVLSHALRPRGIANSRGASRVGRSRSSRATTCEPSSSGVALRSQPCRSAAAPAAAVGPRGSSLVKSRATSWSTSSGGRRRRSVGVVGVPVAPRSSNTASTRRVADYDAWRRVYDRVSESNANLG